MDIRMKFGRLHAADRRSKRNPLLRYISLAAADSERSTSCRSYIAVKSAGYVCDQGIGIESDIPWKCVRVKEQGKLLLCPATDS